MRTPVEDPARLIDAVFAALDGRGVRWSLLRGFADLENLSRDLDLLVAAEDLPAFEEVVVALGGVRLPRWLQGWHRFYWFRPPALSRPGLTLDVVTALTYGRGGRLPTDLAPGCLERRVQRGGRYQLSPTDTFWTVLLHCLLDKGEVKQRRALELTDALPTLVRPSDGEAVVGQVCPDGWSPDRLVACVRDGDWASLNRLARSLASDVEEADNPPNRQTAAEGSGTILSAKRHLPQRNSVSGNVVKAAYATAWKLVRRASQRLGGPRT